MLLGRQLPWTPIANAIAALLHIEVKIEESPPSWIEYAFVILILGVLSYVVIQIHRNWTGSISVEDYDSEQRKINNGLIDAALREFQRYVQRRPVVIWGPELSFGNEHALAKVEDSLAWHEQAAELFILSSESYRIDLQNDWRDKPGVWLGTAMNGTKTLALIPLDSDGQLDHLQAVVSWVKQSTFEKVVEIHVACRGGATSKLSIDPDVAIHYEEELLDRLVDWTDYRFYINRRFEAERLLESNLSIKDVYVHPKIEPVDRRCDANDLEQELDVWLTEKSGRQIALLGEYGMGKSVSALAVTYRLLNLKDAGRVPILIELRGKSPRNQTPLEILGAWSAPFRISARSLMRLHSAGKILLIFEGFDEMALIGDAELRLKHFSSLWRFCFPNAKILITGRPNFFLDQSERMRSLGIGRPDGNRAFCVAFRLVPFDLSQIEAALRNQPLSVSSQILDIAGRNERFLELVSRPSILHVAASLWERENLHVKADKLTAAELMELFVRSSYRRQGLKESDLSSEFMALTESEREYFMTGIAAYMMDKGLPNQITSTDLDRLIEELVSTIPDEVTVGSGVLTNQSRSPLKQRLSESEQGLEHVKTDVRTCGLLVDEPSLPGTFRFGHKSILEFIFASFWFHSATDEDNVGNQALQSILKLGPLTLSRSREARRFFCELLLRQVELGAQKRASAEKNDGNVGDLENWNKVSEIIVGMAKSTVFEWYWCVLGFLHTDGCVGLSRV